MKIIDNRDYKELLEIETCGLGNWYVHNESNGKILPVYSKSEAEFVIRNSEHYDI